MVLQYARAAEIARLQGAPQQRVARLFLCAAWCADDAKDKKTAVAMRKLALKEFLAVKERTNDLLLQMCDVARRAEMKEKALELLDAFDKLTADEPLRKIAAYQRLLLSQNDLACHMVSEALAR
ncbi:MAG: hypothetical protein Q4G59_12840 [Planctomycetia bacterium]|nr:hypothetical protein [Planctomycetia bacterium]